MKGKIISLEAWKDRKREEFVEESEVLLDRIDSNHFQAILDELNRNNNELTIEVSFEDVDEDVLNLLNQEKNDRLIEIKIVGSVIKTL